SAKTEQKNDEQKITDAEIIETNNYCNDNSTVEYLAGNRGNIVRIIDVPYSDLIVDFFDDLSKQIREGKTAGNDNLTVNNTKFADVISFAFWCRRSNILKLKSAYLDGKKRLGRGLVFHIAPSNVPINFAFSFAFGLLAGNSNIVRVPSKLFPQTEIICSAIDVVLRADKYKSIRESNSFIRYARSDELTAKISAKSQGRIIWGGDQTIQNIRKFQIAANGVEITFADRYSFCVINSDAVNRLNDVELDKLANNFYNDTYLIDQNACSSPHLILWTNNYCNDKSKPSDKTAKQKFWNAVYSRAGGGKIGTIVGKGYELSGIHAVDKYAQLCRFAIDCDDIESVICYENLLYRVLLKKLPTDADKLRGRFGVFFEYDLRQLDELREVVNSKYQTLTYFGVDNELLSDWIISRRLQGIDRIVPIGSALDINVIWDGYDIVKFLSRIVQ
ncbi:MAG: hypothetical protein LBK06_09010, partial [Planctomycetaceae bacterium]|nr:hypothetical protein [Planctomycetaceae bacterium]